jgi:hypothetical protein
VTCLLLSSFNPSSSSLAQKRIKLVCMHNLTACACLSAGCRLPVPPPPGLPRQPYLTAAAIRNASAGGAAAP